MIHFSLQLGRNWIYIYLHFTFRFYFSHSFFLFYAFVGLKMKPKSLAVFILLLAINCSHRCFSFSTRIRFKRSRSSHTGQRKSLPHAAAVAAVATHIGKILRIHSCLREMTKRKKRRKQKQQNTLSLLRFIQCHRHAATAAVAVYRTAEHEKSDFSIELITEWL